MDVHPEEWALPARSLANPRQDGLCTQTDPALFYLEVGESGAMAKFLCGRCPLKDECLEGAVSRGETYGIWGGQNFAIVPDEDSPEPKEVVAPPKKRRRVTRLAPATGQSALTEGLAG